MSDIPKPVFLNRDERREIREKLVYGGDVKCRPKYVDDEKTSGRMVDDQHNTKQNATYLNKTVKKRRMSDAKKLLFGWNEDEDTSRMDDIYVDRPLPLVLGRSHVRDWDDLGNNSGRKTNPFGDTDGHWSGKKLHEMTERDWRILREDYGINAYGGYVPNPIRSWRESDVPVEIQDILENLGYKEPTPIQRQVIPVSLINRDVIGMAETGSGKTLAFVLPILISIRKVPDIDVRSADNGPHAIILVPTRELALQIESEIKRFSVHLNVNCVSILGGRSIMAQSFYITSGVDIVVATPGRLRDCLSQRILVLQRCTHVVMDEADRMIDLGFEDDISFILNCLPVSGSKTEHSKKTSAVSLVEKHRVTSMFSATMPPAVERLARSYLIKPVSVTVGAVGQVADTIEQVVEVVPENKKKGRLLDVLKSRFEPPIIIFANSKDNVDMICKLLINEKYNAVSLHSGKNQESREIAINSIKSGKKDIIVATDVAGRGIDIKNVGLVINYDMTHTIEGYVHRIGRTGRAGKHGVALTFLTSESADIYSDLHALLSKSKKSVYPKHLINSGRMKGKLSKKY